MTVFISDELYWLTLTTVMTALLWLPYIVNRMREQGVFKAIWDPQGDTSTQVLWAHRMMQAHQNAIENLVIFSTLVILLILTETNTDLTATACMIYFFTRLIHAIAFTFAVPILRVITFLVGFSVHIILGLTVLGQI